MRSRLHSSGPVSNDNAKNLSTRLGRMEVELERVNRLIASIPTRLGLDGGFHEYMTLKEFLEQEMWFLMSNLYFKHRVHSELELDSNLPLLKNLPKHFPLALSWLLQAIIEEMENMKAGTFALRASSSDSGIEIRFTIKEGKLSEEFLDLLTHDISPNQHLNIADDALGALLALWVLKSGAGSVTVAVEPSESKLILAVCTLDAG